MVNLNFVLQKKIKQEVEILEKIFQGKLVLNTTKEMQKVKIQTLKELGKELKLDGFC